MIYFNDLKQPLHQTELASCVPTCIKVILNHQFSLSLKEKQIKKWLGYTILGCVPHSIRNLSEKLKREGIELKEKIVKNEKELIDLIKNKHLPLVYFRANYLDGFSEEVEVDEDGNKYYHSVVLIGVDDEKEKFYIYDSLFSYGNVATLKIESVKVIMPYPKFISELEKTDNRVFWFERTKKKDRTIGEFENGKKD